MGLFNFEMANRAVDGLGNPVKNAVRHIYAMGSETRAPVFQDPDLTLTQSSDMKSDENGFFDLCYLQDGLYRVEILDLKAPNGALLYEAENIEVGIADQLRALRQFETVQELSDDRVLSYMPGKGRLPVRPGSLLRVAAPDMQFRVAAPDEAHFHVTTAGGVKFCEAGTRYSSEARFAEAVARGESFALETAVTAGGSVYFHAGDGNTALPELVGWTRILSPQTGSDVAAMKAKSDFITVSQPVNVDVLPALVASSNTYDSVAAGLAATTDGAVFFVATGPGLQLYRKEAGQGVFVGWHGEVVFETVGDLLASSEDFPEGMVVQTRNEGFKYRVAPSAATDHSLKTTGGAKLYIKPRDGGWVMAEQFGITGTANDTDVLAAMAAYGRAAGVLRWRAKSGVTYTCDRPWIFGSIPVLEIDGNGAFWQNPRGTLGTNVATNMVNEGMYFPTVFESIDVTTSSLSRTFEYGELIETADENTTTIEMNSDAAMGAYSVGMRCVLFGFCLQTSGFPLTTRYFEWVEITAIAETTITIKNKLRFTYDKDWPEISTNVSHAYKGPPRLLPLSRTNFEEIRKLNIRNLTLLADPGWLEADGGTINRNGRLSVGGYETCTLQNVNSEGGFYILSGRDCESRQCVFAGAAEMDKVVGSYRDFGSKMLNMSQGTGTQNATLSDTVFHESISQITALDSLTLNNVSVLGEAKSSQIIAPTFGCRRVAINGGLYRRKNGTNAMFTGSALAQAFTAVSATVISTTLSALRSNIMFMRQMWIGQVLWAIDGTPLFEIERIYASGSDVHFQVRPINTGFISGDELWVSQMSEITMGQPFTLSPLTGATKLPLLNGSNGHGFFGRVRDGKPETLSFALEPQIGTVGHSAHLKGVMRPTRITIDVMKAYSGTTATARLSFRSTTSGADQFIEVNLRTPGKRAVDLTGAVGAVSGDTLAALPSKLSRVFFKANTALDYASQEDEAIWTMTIEGPYLVDMFG